MGNEIITLLLILLIIVVVYISCKRHRKEGFGNMQQYQEQDQEQEQESPSTLAQEPPSQQPVTMTESSNPSVMWIIIGIVVVLLFCGFGILLYKTNE